MNFSHIGSKDGLIGGTVSSILQSRSGFMWIGMYPGGLYKYDGYSLKKYPALKSDSTGLLSAEVLSLTEDSTGNIWVGTGNAGLYVLHPKTNKIKHFVHNKQDSTSISGNSLFQVLTDSKNQLWALTNGGLDQYDPIHRKFIHYPYDTNNTYFHGSHYPIDRSVMVLDWKKGMLLVAGFHVYYPDPKTRRLMVLPFSDNNVRVGVDVILPQKDYGIGVFVYGREKEFKRICKFDISTQKIIESYCDFPAWACQEIIRADNNSYYVATSSGLYILNTITKSFTPIEYNKAEGDKQFVSRIWTMISDRNQNLWIGTKSGGIYMLDKRKNIFANHVLNPPVGAAIDLDKIAKVLMITRDGRLMTVSTLGKAYIWDSISREFKYAFQVTPDKGSSYVSWVNDIYEDHFSNLWASVVYEGPIYIRDKKTGVSKRAYSGNDSLVKTGADIYEDRSGLIWIGGYNYNNVWNDFACINDLTGEIRAFKLPNHEDKTNTSFTTTFFEDKEGRFWIVSDKGVYLFDRVSGKYTLYSHNSKDPKSISTDGIAILCLLEDKAGRFWAATYGGGLDLFDRATGTFTHFTEKDGLGSNYIKAMVEAKDGTLWMATLAGVSRFDPESRIFTSYGWDDGIYFSNFVRSSASILPSGEIFFGAEGGVLSFFPEKVTSVMTYAPLAVTSFNVTGVNKYTELTNSDSIDLAYDENDFSFEFAALDFGSPDSKKYAYKLDGFDNDWRMIGSKNFASFTNIPPGSYVFRVKSMTRNGKWDPKEIAVVITIAPPFWGTWWFRSAAALLVIGSIWYGFRRRELRSKQYLADLEAAREKERLELASELHDGPLQDLYATRFILEPIAARADENARQLEELLTKVRSDLRSITSELQMPRFDLGLGEELALALDTFKDIHPQIMTKVDIHREESVLSPVTMQNYFRIFRTALSNILKHSSATEILLYFRSSGGTTEMRVTDNGNGFRVPDDLGELARTQHYGLFMMKNFAAQIGARCDVQSEQGKGTTISVIMKA